MTIDSDDQKYQFVGAKNISDPRSKDLSCYLFNEIPVCGDQRPLWQKFSFIENDIVRLFCQSFLMGIFGFTLPVFRQAFISFSRLERKANKKPFRISLDRLVEEGILLKIPRYKVNGSFFQLIYDRSSCPHDLEIVHSELENTRGVYDLFFDKDKNQFSFYFNRSYYEALGENLSACPIWINDYYEIPPYFSDNDHTEILYEHDPTKIVDRKETYALNLAITHSLFFEVHELSCFSPIGLYQDSYNILAQLASIYPDAISLEDLANRIGKNIRSTRDRLQDLEPFALVGKVNPLDEIELYLRKKIELPMWLKELIPSEILPKLLEKLSVLSSSRSSITQKEHYFLNYGNFLNNKEEESVVEKVK